MVVIRVELILFEKLKFFKDRIKIWNREVFSRIDLKVTEDVGIINEMDNFLVDNFRGKIHSLIDSRKYVTRELWNCMFVKESMLRQKSMQLWLKEDDKISRFFHNSIKYRHRKGAI